MFGGSSSKRASCTGQLLLVDDADNCMNSTLRFQILLPALEAN
ncbi:hypothetical protein LPU83_pLPU83c_0178 (plasmid) [Rhizobium favelukesii]|uniref:Uncharacterized protein n=1 Tax=Rhizobium favelukesii TaxID=348824 RepID=W6RK94_9HYPH|nr:hypothetical protein LPU83_pLPU83c_0178 [Rhizobium favelukesii]